jgi:predicted NACHT family NTPase
MSTKINRHPQHHLLEAVKNEVNARLEQSLHNAVIINLYKGNTPTQVQRLWDLEVKIGKRENFTLPRSKSVTDVFDQTEGKLLILGALGAGKTTTLLELARDLIHRVENDPTQPIPVLFDLLSWQNNQTLADWLIAELQSKYGIQNKMGKQLLQLQQILPLLDGLDELELPRRELCLQAINQFLKEENQPKHLVVCTPLEEYKSCQTKLRLHGALYLRPLTNEQIQHYLIEASSRQLWYSIKDDQSLLALAKTPLFLNMMTLGYDEILIHAWKRLESRQERRNYLLNAYIRWMLTWKIKSQFYPKKEPRPEATRSWLVFLAKRMKEGNQTEFAIQQIQPNWLQTQTQKRLYQTGVALMLGGIAGMQRFVLRFVLWRQGYIPWNYARFLGLATERLFLQRMGGRYRFTHELLRDYLAQI